MLNPRLSAHFRRARTMHNGELEGCTRSTYRSILCLFKNPSVSLFAHFQIQLNKLLNISSIISIAVISSVSGVYYYFKWTTNENGGAPNRQARHGSSRNRTHATSSIRDDGATLDEGEECFVNIDLN